MPKGYKLDQAGRWRKNGKFASAAEVEAAELREAGYIQDDRGRYHYAKGSGKTGYAPNIEVFEAKTEAMHERKNLMFWNRMHADEAAEYKLKGFMNWAKEAFRGKARSEVTSSILSDTSTRNLEEAYAKYADSKAAEVHDAVLYIDENKLRGEFSGIVEDINAYIEYLRSLSKDERYDEANAQQELWMARYGTA